MAESENITLARTGSVTSLRTSSSGAVQFVVKTLMKMVECF